jgi:hypothetical protein
MGCALAKPKTLQCNDATMVMGIATLNPLYGLTGGNVHTNPAISVTLNFILL